jgi:hypothetical protein
VDYTNVEATAHVLAERKVHTIISTIQGLDPTASDSQVSLIRAASLSSSVKRFIAGGFGALPAARQVIIKPSLFFDRCNLR